MLKNIIVRTALVTNFRDGFADGQFAACKRTEGPTITVEADQTVDLDAVAESAWRIGNRMAADESGVAWPSNVRSMSMGDVVFVTDRDQNEHAMVADLTGFREVSRDVTQDYTNPRSAQGERGPWADESSIVVAGEIGA